MGELAAELLGQRRRLGIARGKSADETLQLFPGEAGQELNTGQPGGGEQLRKTALGVSAVDGYSVQQELGTRGTKQEPGLAADGHRRS